MVTPHRTALNLFIAPTPIIEPVIVCVVETGIPMFDTVNNVKAPAVSAQTPSKWCHFGYFCSHRFYDFPTTH